MKTCSDRRQHPTIALDLQYAKEQETSGGVYAAARVFTLMDDADRADERTQNLIDGGIAIAREKAAKVRALVPVNNCYYCDGYVNNGVVFCDKDCQSDYYHDIQRRKDLGL